MNFQAFPQVIPALFRHFSPQELWDANSYSLTGEQSVPGAALPLPVLHPGIPAWSFVQLPIFHGVHTTFQLSIQDMFYSCALHPLVGIINKAAK